jgi:16S rRNA (uracil1498-N3)-methyltransferase
LNLFYQPNINETSQDVSFDKIESRHISKVLRKVEGDIISLTNGKGFFFEAKLTNTNPKKCNAVIVNAKKQAPLPYHLHLAVAPTKLNDRYEWFLEKATEIGVTEITPIICDHSERKVINQERYNKIIQSAMKQSLKSYLPTLNEAVSFKNFLAREHSEEIRCIAHCEDTDKKTLKSVIKHEKSTLILIGPEGDFSINEIESALSLQITPISLGNSRLRTETAAILACHSVYFTVIV